MMEILKIGLIPYALMLVACAATGPKNTPLPGSDLTVTQAQERTRIISQIAYTLNVELTATDNTFQGRNQISFNLNEIPTFLRLDLFNADVKSLEVNGNPLGPESRKPHWIEIPGNTLHEGSNVIVVEYIQPYSTQGQGLHRFIDPETKEVFLHSQFETFDANRFFPCFDQPDLKATLDLTVEAPAEWEVITTTSEVSVVKQRGRRIWKFEKTPLLSTYVFSLHAGPYKIWRDRYEDLPLRIFARPTMAKYVRAQEWFTWTKKGLRFFNSYFDYPYPFKKYDQLFVPEFNAGAMENVGAVTFSESFLRRSEATRDERRAAAGTLLHEMAHMWFGDLVTMKWWNDLWLNESFATIMSASSLYEATEFKESWQAFFSGMKNWAYWEDQLSTTHPIEAPVMSVKQAYATFDGITYGKGASVIKQLKAYMGSEEFKAGVRDYIKAHAYKNAELKDFIAALQTRTSRDLASWAERWLKQPGVDKLSAQWTCNEAQLSEVTLTLTPAIGTKFRPQLVHVGLIKDRNQKLQMLAAPAVALTGEKQTIKGLWPCPDAVYPNFGDDGYVAVQLDTQTLAFIKKNLGRTDDKLLRTMIWHDLWQMVRATELPLMEYIEIVKNNFPPESDAIIANKVAQSVSAALYYWPKDEKSENEKLAFIKGLEADYLERLLRARPGSDPQRLWFDHFVSIARSEAGLAQLAKWFAKKKIAPGFPLDVDRKWTIVTQLARYNHPDAETVLTQMRKEDHSDRGERMALAADAIRPLPEVKEKWLTRLGTEKPDLSLASARAVLGALFPYEQAPLAKPFENDFYSYLKTYGRDENEVYVKTFAGSTAPLRCHGQESQRLKAFLGDEPSLNPSVKKLLSAVLEEDERCQRVRARARNP